jgi:TBC1 domain family member 25
MNEYASTLLYVMREEALAYICFCSIMRRIRANFATDGVAIATKFHHLKVILRAVDPVFWSFLESCDAGKVIEDLFQTFYTFALR